MPPRGAPLCNRNAPVYGGSHCGPAGDPSLAAGGPGADGDDLSRVRQKALPQGATRG